MPGTFHSATGGTFVPVMGGTFKPLPSVNAIYPNRSYNIELSYAAVIAIIAMTMKMQASLRRSACLPKL